VGENEGLTQDEKSYPMDTIPQNLGSFCLQFLSYLALYVCVCVGKWTETIFCWKIFGSWMLSFTCMEFFTYFCAKKFGPIYGSPDNGDAHICIIWSLSPVCPDT